MKPAKILPIYMSADQVDQFVDWWTDQGHTMHELVSSSNEYKTKQLIKFQRQLNPSGQFTMEL